MDDLFKSSSATFSPCRQYRYELWRRWDSSQPYALFICLNPSIADENVNDPTARRCMRYAADWGFGALCIVNLFAYRATKPEEMTCARDPIGEGNDETLVRLATGAGVIVAAWGAMGSHLDRDAEVVKLIPRPLQCLDKCQSGQPRHPLYMSKAAILQPYP